MTVVIRFSCHKTNELNVNINIMMHSCYKQTELWKSPHDDCSLRPFGWFFFSNAKASQDMICALLKSFPLFLLKLLLHIKGSRKYKCLDTDRTISVWRTKFVCCTYLFSKLSTAGVFQPKDALLTTPADQLFPHFKPPTTSAGVI